MVADSPPRFPSSPAEIVRCIAARALRPSVRAVSKLIRPKGSRESENLFLYLEFTMQVQQDKEIVTQRESSFRIVFADNYERSNTMSHNQHLSKKSGKVY